MAKSKEKIMEIVFLLAACVSILAVSINMCIPFRKRNTGDEENRLCRFSSWYYMETGK